MPLQAIYSILSEEQQVQRIDTDVLFRWFLGMDPAEDVFDPTAFTHNREHAIVSTFFDAVLNKTLQAELCRDHFSVNGTLLESDASTKSFQPKVPPETAREKNIDSPEDQAPRDPPAAPPSDSNSFKSRNPEVDFHGQKRANEPHSSRTDPEAKLSRKGNGLPSILAHMGHVLPENRHGLILRVRVTGASGTAEREAALSMLEQHEKQTGHLPKTVGAGNGYDSGEFFQTLASRGIEPRIATRDVKRDPETIRPHQQAAHEARVRMQARRDETGDQLRQRCRKKVEERFGWFKTIAGLDKLKHVGQWKIQQQLELAGAAFNLIRLRKQAPLT